MHRLEVFYYCQRFYQVAIERNKILRYENLDKFITVNRYVLVSGRISNKFQYFERTNLVLIFRQFSPPFSCKVVSCVERFCFSSEIEVHKIYFSALLSKELDMM